MDLWDRVCQRRRYGRFADLKLPHITCPSCCRTSYNQNDIREGYCGSCHDWTSPPDGGTVVIPATRGVDD